MRIFFQKFVMEMMRPLSIERQDLLRSFLGEFFAVLLLLFSFFFQISNVQADEIDDFLRDCEYICLPAGIEEQQVNKEVAKSFADMVYGCSAGVEWNDMSFMQKQIFSGQQSWGKHLPDSLQTVWPDKAVIPFRHPAAKFSGLYSRMFDKVTREADSEAKRIVATRAGLNEVELNRVLSNDLTPLLETGMEIDDAYAQRDLIVQMYQDEKHVTDIAGELKAEIVPTEIFSNATIDDSGYDLIVDLNIMEKILFNRDSPIDDIGLVMNNESDDDNKSYPAAALESDAEKELEAQCEAIEEGKVVTKSLDSKRIAGILPSGLADHVLTENGGADAKEVILAAQDNENPQQEHVDPASCDPESQTLDNAVEEFFLENSDDEEIAQLEEDFEEAVNKQQNPPDDDGDGDGEDEGGEEIVIVNGEEMTEEEYEELVEKCEERENEDFFEEEDNPKETVENLLGHDEINVFKCKSGDAGPENEKEGIKIEAKVCIEIKLENETATKYVASDNCIQCHIDYINKELEKVLNINYTTDKVSGNILEPNICKLGAVGLPVLGVHFSTKPVVPPRPTSLDDNANWSVNFKSLADAALGGFTKDDPAFTREQRISNYVNSRKPRDAKIDDITFQINNLIAEEEANVTERLKKLKTDMTFTNRSQFGQALEYELNDMLASFQAMNQMFGELRKESCETLKSIPPVP